MKQSQLNQALKNTPVKEFRYFDTIGSTNDEALSWADAGAPDFSLVLADEQTKGRGRFSRHWSTNPGTSLALSLILQPSPSETQKLAMFAPLCGLALRDVLQTTLGLTAEIKWPNDILISSKKTAGILVEASWSGEMVAGLVLGIGINITHRSLPPMNNQLFPATCIEDELGHQVDRLKLLVELLNALAKWRDLLGTDTFMEEWQKHLAFKNKRVRIEDSQKTSIIGIVKGINTSGNLVLILENGFEQDFAVGDVHMRPYETDFVGGK